MARSRGRCSFCRGVATQGPFDPYGPFEPHAPVLVCDACTTRIASLAGRGALRDVWDAPPHSAQKAALSIDAFNLEVVRIRSEDAESHFNLAVAYREMGLFGDAAREAALALSADIRGPNAEAALRLLLTRPIVTVDRLEALREHLRLRLVKT